MMEINTQENVKPDISVIIPTYNVEKYIEECIDSLRKQTWENFEIICVDDGSTDKTVEILQNYEKEDKRIKVLPMEHCGLAGVMRNKGIQIARGEYCLFLDGDDFFEPEMLEHSLKKAREDDADICMFDARNYYEETKKFKENKVNLKKEYIQIGRAHV